MSKKLLMNNYSENDEIILCENYSPNGQKFYLWQDKIINWDKYELYINIDCTNHPDNLGNLLSVGSNIGLYNHPNRGQIHIYYSLNKLGVHYIHNWDKSVVYYIRLLKVDKVEIIINKQGTFVNGELQTSNSDVVNIVNSFLQNNQISIGSQEGANRSYATYHKVSLRKYQERD